ncbi:class I SAM-dependent methyltransferase [Poritiphilus flavus]|uniref:Methyltransferase domain-containing protein n=1 Tax=Poritiphilus flavus TaxID=2697053 RepID=A0A6L9ECK6_9FLAO|nr:class I SAM-dependent methyltransferase [Poritiphilus flavus]NAS12268.1 methyltransferase domain-containing protein [Poritiphilus flavus]
MNTLELFDSHVEDYEAWYDNYPAVYESEINALREHFQKLPENIRGIEVGLGTGRFAKPLGIKEGAEPSQAMAAVATKRGIQVVDGVAENLPYGDLQFDFVLFVTICHFNNVKSAIEQAYRVLKHGGSLIIGFLDKDQAIAQQYIAKKQRSVFYRKARFYRTAHVVKMLEDVGFKNLEFNQTLFDDLEKIGSPQIPKSGYGKGSFVVVKTTKR